MFGMLDYRAHKLYLLLFGLPTFALALITIFGLPLFSYGFGKAFADIRSLQIIISIVVQLLIDTFWGLIVIQLVQKLFNFIFNIFIDVIPSDERTKEEAQLVVYNGEKAIILSKIARIHPSQWTDEQIESFPKMDWVRNLFFREVTIKRMELVRYYYSTHPDEVFNEHKLLNIIKDSSVTISFTEKIFTNIQYRRTLLLYCFFFYLLVINPF